MSEKASKIVDLIEAGINAVKEVLPHVRDLLNKEIGFGKKPQKKTTKKKTVKKKKVVKTKPKETPAPKESVAVPPKVTE